MKLVFFDDYKLGVLKNGSVVDVGEVVKDIVHTSAQNLVNQLIGDFAKYRQPLENLANRSQGTPIDQVRLRAPLPEPTRIVAMAVNYMEHGTREKAAEIDAFHKSPSCVIGTGDTVMLPDCNPSIFEQEAELGLIIGKDGQQGPARRRLRLHLRLHQLHRRVCQGHPSRRPGQLLLGQDLGHLSGQWGPPLPPPTRCQIP